MSYLLPLSVCFSFVDRYVSAFIRTENIQRKRNSNGCSSKTIFCFSMRNLSTIEIFILLICPHFSAWLSSQQAQHGQTEATWAGVKVKTPDLKVGHWPDSGRWDILHCYFWVAPESGLIFRSLARCKQCGGGHDNLQKWQEAICFTIFREQRNVIH